MPDKVALRSRISVLAGVALFSALPAMAHAVETAAGAESADAGTTIIVTGQAAEPISAGKTGLPIIRTPQAVSVVDDGAIRERAIGSMAELLRLVPGAGAGAGEGHRDQIVLRGNSSTADFFVDGMRDDVQYYRSFYNIDHVEVLKGPNALLFGRGGGGGVINRVTRTPQFASTSVSANAGIDLYGDSVAGADINFGGNALAARLNGFAEHLQTFRGGSGTRWAVNPTAAATLGGVRVDMGYEHVSDRRYVDRGLPSQNGQPLIDGDRLVFGDATTNYTTLAADVLSVHVTVPVTNDLRVDARATAGDYAKFYSNVTPSTAAMTLADGSRQSAVTAYNSRTDRSNRWGQLNLIWTPTSGAVQHTVMLGMDGTRQTTEATRATGFFGASTSATLTYRDRVTVPTVLFRSGAGVSGSTANRTQVDQWSAYAQDQAAIGEHIELLAGIRFDRMTISAINRFTALVTRRSDAMWSPRGAVIVKPVAGLSLYTSFGRSFLPQSGDQFSALDATNATLAPERFDNWEAGGKYQLARRLLATIAVYRLDRTNSRAVGPTPGSIVLTGAQRSEGVEFELSGELARGWHLDAAAAYTDARYRGGDFAGRRVPLVPRFAANIWARHDFTRSIGAALGVVHQSSCYASTSNAARLPGWTRIDGALFLRPDEHVEVQFNAENLGGIRYAALAQGDNNIAPGSPRTVRATVRLRY